VGCARPEHDLEELAALLPPGGRSPCRSANWVGMAPYAVDVRYADDWREPGIQQALQSQALAERNWIGSAPFCCRLKLSSSQSFRRPA